MVYPVSDCVHMLRNGNEGVMWSWLLYWRRKW